MLTSRTFTLEESHWKAFVILLLLNLSGVYSKKDKCEICNDIIKAFDKGLKKTEKSNFGGGNTDWEERKLGSYADSETRFVEIVESLCTSSDHACHSMVEENEEIIETWWFKERSKNKEFKTWLCEDKFKVCCPNGTFGADCKDCPGGKEKPCNGKGKCKGDGTRTGDGVCKCNSGYEGEKCDECKDGFYEEYDQEKNLTCKVCHVSCTTCTGGTSKDCDECERGWLKSDEGECQDVNECDEADKCQGGEYCLNKPGTSECNACDSSCEGNCTGSGGKGCEACKTGYKMDEELGCQDIDECSEEVKCKDDEWCKNTPGTYECVGCHSACKTCVSAGPKECTSCSDGYELIGDKGCKDVDECAVDENPCNEQNEICKNNLGGYECECDKGFRRKGKICVKEESKEESKDDDDDKDEDDDDDDDDDDGEDAEEESAPEHSKAESQSRDEL